MSYSQSIHTENDILQALQSLPKRQSELDDLLIQIAQEPDHLDTETMFAFLGATLSLSDRIRCMKHLESCSFCAGEVLDLMEVVDVQPVPLWQRLEMSLTHVQTTIKTALNPIPPLELRASFAEDASLTDENTLDFDDPNISANIEKNGESYLLHIEHALYPPGTLALLEFENAEGEVVLAQPILFQRGWQPTFAQAHLFYERVSECTPRLREITLASVTEEDEEAWAVAIQQAFEQLSTLDQATTQEAWRLWAEQTLKEVRLHEIRVCAEYILSRMTE